jgi:O-antigen/teichoic acid export membrane protein
MQYIAIERVLVAGTYLASIFLFIKNSNNLLLVPIVFAISNLIGALFLFIVYRVTHTIRNHIPIKLDFKEWRQLLIQALPIGLGAILIQFSTNFNTIFLGLVKSDNEVGLFSAANKLLVFILIFDRVFCNTTFPIISRYFIIGKEKLSLLLTRLQKLLFIIAIPICVGGFILSPDITKLIYGQTYQPSFLIFRILVWFLIITMLNSLYTSSLIAGKRNKDYVWAIGIGVVTNIILNIILVPIIAGKGTAIALISAEFVTFIVLIYKTKPLAQIKFILINVIKPIIATIIMTIAIYLLYSKISVIPLILLSAIIYSITILLMRGITKQDIRTGQPES